MKSRWDAPAFCVCTANRADCGAGQLLSARGSPRSQVLPRAGRLRAARSARSSTGPPAAALADTRCASGRSRSRHTFRTLLAGVRSLLSLRGLRLRLRTRAACLSTGSRASHVFSLLISGHHTYLQMKVIYQLLITKIMGKQPYMGTGNRG